MSRSRKLFVAPLVLATLLSGYAGPADQGSNPLDDVKKVVELAPWAKEIADNAGKQEVLARAAELQAILATLDIPQSTRDDVAKKLAELTKSLTTNPDTAKTAVTQLRAIIDELKAAEK